MTAGENLIFLISQPRSGSTLLQRMLAGHPQIHTSPEPWLMIHPLYALRSTGIQAEYSAVISARHIAGFVDGLPGGRGAYYQAIQHMAGYLYDQALEGTGKRYYLDKTPRYYLVIPELLAVFPRARFILLLRNPLAVLSSILDNVPMPLWDTQADQLRIDLLEAPLRLLEGYEHLKQNGAACALLRYEQFVSDPRGTLEALCQSIGLELAPEMMTYGQVPQGAWGDQVNIRKHDRPVGDYVDKWAEKLKSHQRWVLAERYLAALGPERFAALGYSYDDTRRILQSHPPRRRFTPVISWRTLLTPSERRSWWSRQYFRMWLALHRARKKVAQPLARLTRNSS